VIVCLCTFISGATGNVAAYQPAEQDIEEVNGGVVYVGEELRLSFRNSNLNVSEGDTVYLVQYTDRPEYTVEATYSLGENLVAEGVSTDNIAAGEEYAFADSSGSSGNTDGNFTLLQSDFSAEWEQSSANTGDEILVDIESSRTDEYSLTVSADGMSYDKLAALFGDDASIEQNEQAIPFEELGYDPEDTDVEDVAEDDYLTISDWKTEDGDLRADFSELSSKEGFPPAGEYEFNFLVTGTGSEDTSTIEVQEGSESATLTKEVYGHAAGDMASFKFNLEGSSETFVQIKQENAFVDVLYVELDDQDEQASIQINTRLLGTDHRSLNGAGDVYQSENVETLVSAYHDGPSERYDSPGEQPFNDGSLGGTASPKFNNIPIFGTGDGTALSYEEYLRAGGIISSSETMGGQLNQPLQPAEYTISIAGYKNVNQNQGILNARTGEPFDTLNSASMVLQKPGVKNVSVYRLPEGTADDVDDISEAINSRDRVQNVSWGDRIVVAYELTGVYGTIAAGGAKRDIDNDRLNEGFETGLLRDLSRSDQGIRFTIERQSEVGNNEQTKVDFQSSGAATHGVVDYTEKRVYVIVNTRSGDAFTRNLPDSEVPFTAAVGYGTGDEAKTEYAFAEGDPLNGPFSVNGEESKHPYLTPDTERVRTETFYLGPPRVSFADRAFDVLPLQQGDAIEVKARTNIASGKGGVIKIRSENRSVVSAGEISIEDGVLSAGPLDLTQFNHAEPISVSVNIKDGGTYTTSGVVVGDTNDIVLRDGSFDDSISDPTAVERGILVSQLVSWGSPPPIEFQDEEQNRSNSEQSNGVNESSNRDSTGEGRSQQSQTGAVDGETESNQEASAVDEKQEQSPTQPDENSGTDSGNGGGFGFIPVVGTVFISIIIGAAAAVII
jgi:hypothetical protein